jgi:hypothetical protein
MNSTIKSLASIALLALCVCGVSCAHREPAGQTAHPGDRQLSITRTADGATFTEIYTMHAVVAVVDKSTRSVTLEGPEGKKKTFKAGDDVRNFDQIAVGDRVTAQVWEVLAMYLVRNGNPSDTDAAVALAAARAPKGTKPGGFVVSTTEEFATVIAVAPDRAQGNLKVPDGQGHACQVGDNGGLTGREPGDKVSIRHTAGAAIDVEDKQ